MAKKTVKKATTRRRRDKRKVERGQAHIQSTFNIQSLQLLTQQGMRFPGQVLVSWALEVPENPHPMQHRWLQIQLQKLLPITV